MPTINDAHTFALPIRDIAKRLGLPDRIFARESHTRDFATVVKRAKFGKSGRGIFSNSTPIYRSFSENSKNIL